MDEKNADQNDKDNEEQIKQLMNLGQPTIPQVEFDDDFSQYKESQQKLVDRGDDVVEIRDEFEKCLTLYQQLYEKEVDVRLKTKGTIAELTAKREKLGVFKKFESELNFKTKNMKSEIKRIEKQCDDVAKSEKDLQSQLATCDNQMEEHRKVIESGSGLTKEQKKRLSQAEEEYEEVNVQLQTNTKLLNNLRIKTQEQMKKIQTDKEKKIEVDSTIRNLNDQVKNCKAERDHAQTRKDRLEAQLRELRDSVEEMQEIVEQNKKRTQTEKAEVDAMELKIKLKQKSIGGFIKEYDHLFHAIRKTADSLQERKHTNELLVVNNNRREKETKGREKEVEDIALEVKRAVKMTKFTKKKIAAKGKEMDEYNAKRAEIKGKMANIQSQIAQEKKNMETVNKNIDRELRDREIINKNMVKSDAQMRGTFDQLKVTENTKKNLNNEMNIFQNNARQQRTVIEQLESDGAKYEEECAKANQRYYSALEDVKLRELQIGELQKRIVEGETKLKQQQNMYEGVRSDRNLYSKNLIESQEEIAEMKRNFKIMNHQIEQLKEEITSKDYDLLREHEEHKRVQKEMESLKNDHTRIKKQIQSSDQISNNQHDEIRKLSKIIQEADSERLRQQKEYESVVHERDILGSQLIRRNEELAQLYERIKIQRSTLNKGEAQFNEHTAGEHSLKLAIRDSIEKLEALKSDVSSLDHLRREEYRLGKELLQEQAKATALSEELERPMNVHRWRKLAGSDPKRYGIIQKIQRLQRQLISKTEEVVAKDQLIQNKEKLYVELKNILARQPGPEVAEQLSVYEQNLKQKRQQMAKMRNELEMYKHQVGELEEETNYHGESMDRLEQQYFQSMSMRGQQESLRLTNQIGNTSMSLGSPMDLGI